MIFPFFTTSGLTLEEEALRLNVELKGDLIPLRLVLLMLDNPLKELEFVFLPKKFGLLWLLGEYSQVVVEQLMVFVGKDTLQKFYF